MNIILLSGGSGKRLWPLSNDVRSKQFLKIFRKNDGTKESMVMRMYRMIKEVDPTSTITIATSEKQIPQIKAQLGGNVGISLEPSRRDTFPAIALAASYLKQQGVKDNESVVVCPVDPYVESDYFVCLKELSDNAGKANLTLMGIEPTYPSEKYGYIIPSSKDHISSVLEFKEKPTFEVAQKYIEQGALWNGGVFAFKLSYILEIARNLLGTDSYDHLFQNYANLQKISFDYAVVEKENSINVIRFAGSWNDLGTWNTLTEAMDKFVSGNVASSDCQNTHVINEMDIPVIALGINNSVIVATPDGILVSDKDKSQELKDLVVDSRPMYERRGWGEYKILDYIVKPDHNNSLVKKLFLTSGQHTSYKFHKYRNEVWTITDGFGEIVLDDVVKKVHRGDVIEIKPGTKHSVRAISELHIIEVQIGDRLSEDDAERFVWDWER